ncbi:MAG: hypothetical protein JW741_20255 [Sedimentisphaerales bacterium]|nr:hypothetical protein [Sedimentisphaerales bacterium]
MVDRVELNDNRQDILSHPKRRDRIHILTIDPILATDISERIHSDKRLKRCRLFRAHAAHVRTAIEEIEQMAVETVGSRLLIFDVRRVTLPKLRGIFNAIVGYNRRDFNHLCYTICIGDGPVNLFQNGKALEVFLPYLSSHRVDYHPAVFFYDPFLHYEINEIEVRGIDEQFVIPNVLPRRLIPYFQNGDNVDVSKIRRYFRAVDKDEDVRKERRRTLKRLYKRRFVAQFPERQEQMTSLLSRDGVRVVTEKLNLYPLYFEDWVYTLIQKARTNASAPRSS